MPNLEVRLARPEDAAQVAEVYAAYVQDTTAALETDPPTVEEIEARIICVSSMMNYPFLVCALDGKIVGYAYAHRRYEEAAFDWGVFISTYASLSGLGISRALLEALEEILRAMGIVNIYALALHNAKSQYFHLARGFSEVGRLREAVHKGGKWRDLAYYEKAIALHDENPAPPCGVGEIGESQLEKILRRAEKSIKV